MNKKVIQKIVLVLFISVFLLSSATKFVRANNGDFFYLEEAEELEEIQEEEEIIYAEEVEKKPEKDNTDVESLSEKEKIEKIKEAIEEYRETILKHFSSQQGRAQDKLDELENNLKENYFKFDDQSSLIDQLEKELPKLRKEITTLQEQLVLIDEQLALSKLKISLTEKQIDKKREEIFNLMKNIEETGVGLNFQREKIVSYIQLMYGEMGKFGSRTSNGYNTFKILLSDITLSSISQRQIYMESLYKKGRYIFNDLHVMRSELVDEEQTLQGKKKSFDDLKNRLEREKKYLAIQQDNKSHLLETTKGQEKEYQEMLEEYKNQQEEVSMQIKALQGNIGIINKRLGDLDKKMEKAEELSEDGKSVEFIYDLEGLLKQGDSFFTIWPVAAERGISAYFHDPTYPFGLHNAIDIPAPQGSNFYTPAPGYVYKTVDNGMGYSYIIVAHRDNVLTVYGHVSYFAVNEGDLVQAGDILGKIGGAPGTKGAGWMTTGAHMHFEVLKENKYVDPFEFLPLDGFIKKAYVPEVHRWRMEK